MEDRVLRAGRRGRERSRWRGLRRGRRGCGPGVLCQLYDFNKGMIEELYFTFNGPSSVLVSF